MRESLCCSGGLITLTSLEYDKFHHLISEINSFSKSLLPYVFFVYLGRGDFSFFDHNRMIRYD